ncbi:MAG: Response regulator receiver domain protein [bacterium]|nr:Response regulator receiver domain protein [bacterium]
MTTHPLRILLVEDNRLNQELVRDLLEAAGHIVHVAGDGTAMHAHLDAAGAPDIILLDVLLPGADGVELLGQLRRSPHATLPVVAVTAQALPGDLERFTAAGFDAVMTKPIDTRSFVGAVERHAWRRRAATEP